MAAAHALPSDPLAGTRSSTMMKDVGTEEFPRRKPFDHDSHCGRIFNSRARSFGVDTKFWEAQMAEKAACGERAKARDAAWMAQAAYADGLMQQAAQEHLSLTRAERAALEAYHKAEQLKHTRREWDLQDDKARHNEPAAREGDDDPRLSTSGMQLFDGEDINHDARVKAQQAQIAAWADAKAAENADCNAAAAAQQARYDAMTAAHTQMAKQAQAEYLAGVSDANAAHAAAWNGQDQERKDCEAKLAAENATMNAAEIEAAVNSNILSERPIPSYLGFHRIRPDHYRGMGREQLAAIRDEQAQQRAEKAACDERSAQREANYAAHAMSMEGLMQQEASQRLADARAAKVALAEEHKRQAEEKRARDKARDELYRNDITNEFHRNFGVCPTTREREKRAEFGL